MKTLGQVAYEAYAKAYPGAASELALPWSRLGDGVKAAWDASVLAVGAVLKKDERTRPRVA